MGAMHGKSEQIVSFLWDARKGQQVGRKRVRPRKGFGMRGLRLADFEPAKAKKKRYAEFLSSVVYIVVFVPYQTRNFRTAES
jgi:hypothetical protein